MGYYAAVLAFSPLGAPRPEGRWAAELAFEGSYVPRLSRAQRTAGFDKPEATNLAPVLLRPRAALSLPGALRVEGSWIPPIRMFEVRANLFSVALSRSFGPAGPLRLTPRLAFTGGHARGPITCNDDLASSTFSDQVYYAFVCHSRQSDDRFEPMEWSGELVASRARPWRSLLPYAGIGARHDHTRFDIGVIRDDGSRDPEHPILALDTTRPYFFGGASWSAARRTRVTSELFYAPGSLLTVRVLAGVRVHE